MDFRRITLVCGHYGSGKTGIALNIALTLAAEGKKTAIADLDIVNPYFRTKDHEKFLSEAGIRLIASKYASSALDLPALPQEMYAVTEDTSLHAVIDVGGDDRGALALGRLRDAILSEGNYEMLFVVNRFRPLTRTAQDALAIMREIEAAAGIKCTHIVNNSNIGRDTAVEDILDSMSYAREISERSCLPLKMTCAYEPVVRQLGNLVPDLFSLKHLAGNTFLSEQKGTLWQM